jgi:hypothetical protein
MKGRLGKFYQGPDGRAALQEVSNYHQMLAGFREAIQETIELKRQH